MRPHRKKRELFRCECLRGGFRRHFYLKSYSGGLSIRKSKEDMPGQGGAPDGVFTSPPAGSVAVHFSFSADSAGHHRGFYGICARHCLAAFEFKRFYQGSSANHGRRPFLDVSDPDSLLDSDGAGVLAVFHQQQSDHFFVERYHRGLLRRVFCYSLPGRAVGVAMRSILTGGWFYNQSRNAFADVL